VQHIRTADIEGHTLPMGVRHLRTVTVCGVRVPIIEATIDQIPQLKDEDGILLDGWFDGERGIIFIRRGLQRTLRRDAVNHEIQHALWAYSGSRDYLAGVTKGKVDHEEQLIRIMTPHLHKIWWSR
jgi:hypothetical protein